jgi:hypothetical protein
MLQRILAWGSKHTETETEKEKEEGVEIDLDKPPSFDIDETHLQKVTPGFVFLKKALNEDQQKWLVHYALTTCGPNEKELQKSFWLPRQRKEDPTEELQLNLTLG